MKRIACCLVIAAALAAAATAQTARSYEYDALGRLTKVSPNAGAPVTYAYDAADNRLSVSAAGISSLVAVTDVAIFYICPAYTTIFAQIGVTGNDYDAPGRTFQLTSVTTPYAFHVYPSGVIDYYGPALPYSTFSYTITNDLGATATGTVELYFFGASNEC